MTLPVNDGLLQVFDVEHGACALLTVPDGAGFRRLMIDCGDNTTTGFKPGNHLVRLGTSYLDQLVITNLDEDHVSGHPSLVENNIYVNWLLFNPSVSGPTIKKLKSETGMGKGIDSLVASLPKFTGVQPSSSPGPADALPGVGLNWFWNAYPQFEDENNLSVALFVEFRGLTFFCPGDMEQAGFKNLLETNKTFRDKVSKVDVLMASHHGRESGLYKPMFEQYGCNPEVTIISDDYMQYETQETSSYYGSKSRGIAWRGSNGNSGTRRVLTTRTDGEVRFSFQQNGCWVSSQKG